MFLQYRRYLTFFCLAVVFSSCSHGSGEPKSAKISSLSDKLSACEAVGFKIANGNSCAPGDDPTVSSVVRILVTQWDGSVALCTGTVIGPRAVLSAGHCLLNAQPDNISIDTIAGSFGGIDYVFHPGFTMSETDSGAVLFNDLAIIFSSQDLPVTAAPILVSRIPQQGEEVVVAGYGLTAPDSSAGTIHAGEATVNNITENHIFVVYADNEAHPCSGDSGGALWVSQNGSMAISGVVSQSDPTVTMNSMCQPGDITLYTNINTAPTIQFILGYVPNASVL